jgi:hypothetical protein
MFTAIGYLVTTKAGIFAPVYHCNCVGIDRNNLVGEPANLFSDLPWKSIAFSTHYYPAIIYFGRG